MIQNEIELKKLDVFLDEWKDRVRTYVMERVNEVIEATKIHSYFPDTVAESNTHNLLNYLAHECKKLGLDYIEYKEYLENYRRESRKARNSLKGIFLKIYTTHSSERLSVLNNFLEREAQIKKAQFINSVENAGGQIVRILSLSFSGKGTLDGYISCEKCDVEVETIIAGGYNIQRAHFRVLVKPLGVRKNKNIEKDLKDFVPRPNVTQAQQDFNTFIERTLKHLDIVNKKKGSRIPTMQKHVVLYGYEDYLINNFGYTRVKEFTDKGYIVFKKELEDRTIYLGMTFCYYILKDNDLPYGKKVIERYNIERDSSVEKVKELAERDNRKEFALLAYLMPKNLKEPMRVEELIYQEKREDAMYKVIPTGLEWKDNYLKRLGEQYIEVNKKTKGRGDIAVENIKKLDVMKHFKRLGFVEHPNLKIANCPVMYLPNQKSKYTHVDYHHAILTPLFMVEETYIDGKINSTPLVFNHEYHSLSDIAQIAQQENSEAIHIMADMLRKKPKNQY